MLSRGASLLLASASLAPLAALLAGLSIYGRAPWEHTVMWIISALCFFVIPLLLISLARSRLGSVPFEFRTIKSVDNAGMAQIVGWLIPFAAKPYVNLTAEPLGVLLVAGLIVFLLHRSHAFQSSPWLVALGYHSYEVQSHAGSTYLLITRRRPSPLASAIQVVQLAEYMLLEKERA